LKIVNFIFNSNIWLASGAAALSAFSSFYLSGNIDLSIVFLTFFFFSLVYNVHGIINRKNNRLFDKTTFKYYKSNYSVYLCIVSTIGFGVILITLPFKCQFLGLSYFILGISYNALRSPKNNSHGLLNFGLYFKTLSTTFIIVSFLVVFILIKNGRSEFDQLLNLITFFIIHICTNTLVGDLRDYHVDHYHKTHTIVSILGYKKVKLSLLVINVFAIIYWLIFQFEIPFLMTIIFTVISIILLKETTKSRLYHYIDTAHFIPILAVLIEVFIFSS
jgi:hypothetical protein